MKSHYDNLLFIINIIIIIINEKILFTLLISFDICCYKIKFNQTFEKNKFIFEKVHKRLIGVKFSKKYLFFNILYTY